MVTSYPVMPTVQLSPVIKQELKLCHLYWYLIFLLQHI